MSGRACARCGAAARPGARFCASCGAPLAAVTSDEGPERPAPSADRPPGGRIGERARALAVVDEVEAALRGVARGRLTDGLAELRGAVPDLLTSLPPGGSATRVLEARVEALAADVVRAYLHALEADLSGREPPVVGAAARGLGARFAGEGSERRAAGEAPPAGGARRPRDPLSAVLAGAGLVSMAVIGGPAGLAVGAGMLAGAWKARKVADDRFDQDSGEAARAAVGAWLDHAESALSTELDAIADRVRGAVEERVRALTAAS